MNSIEQVWNDYHSKLRGFIGKRIGNAAEADDVLQNVFVKICAHFKTLKEPDKIQSWLFQIARNAVIDFYRTKKLEVELPEEIALAETAETIDKDKCFRDAQKCLLPMINRLPANYQTTVKLSELEGWTQKRVAAAEGVSLSAVKSRVQRGRKMIKKMLEDCCRFEVDRRGHPIGCEPKKTANICC